jgi:hypothetical protein
MIAQTEMWKLLIFALLYGVLLFFVVAVLGVVWKKRDNLVLRHIWGYSLFMTIDATEPDFDCCLNLD